MKKILIALLIAIGAAFSTFASDPAPEFQDYARKPGVAYSYISPELVSSMPQMSYSLESYGWFGAGNMSIESVRVDAESDLSKKLLDQTDEMIKRNKLNILATKTSGPDSSYTIYGKKDADSNNMTDMLFIETLSASGHSYVKVVSLKGEINLQSLR